MDSKGFLRDLFLAAAEASHPIEPPPLNPLDDLIEAAISKRLEDIGLPVEPLAGEDVVYKKNSDRSSNGGGGGRGWGDDDLESEAGRIFKGAAWKSLTDKERDVHGEASPSSEILKALAGPSGNIVGSSPYILAAALASALGMSNVTGGAALPPWLSRGGFGAGTAVGADYLQKMVTGRDTGNPYDYAGELTKKALLGGGLSSGGGWLADALGGVPHIDKIAPVLDDVLLAILAGQGASAEVKEK